MGSTIGAVLLGWFVFFVLWTLFILAYADGSVPLASRAGAIATGLSALGSAFVWPLTGRLPWKEQAKLRFLAAHLAISSLFSLVWTVLGVIVAFILAGESLSQVVWSVPENAWRLLMGIWLYAILAGLSYAERNRRSLRDREREADQAKALAVTARLETLRSRLQPHFLFNALQSLVALIRTDVDVAEEVIERLGGLLRYAIRDRDSEFVSLSEELAFTEDYLSIEQVRHPALEISREIDPSTTGFLVPAFVLQPLVENAVIHGLAEKRAGGIITLTSTLRGDTVLLRVQDNGCGMKADSGGGSGIATLRERLDALYQGRATLEIESSAFNNYGGASTLVSGASIVAQGTAVVVSIPVSHS